MIYDKGVNSYVTSEDYCASNNGEYKEGTPFTLNVLPKTGGQPKSLADENTLSLNVMDMTDDGVVKAVNLFTGETVTACEIPGISFSAGFLPDNDSITVYGNISVFIPTAGLPTIGLTCTSKKFFSKLLTFRAVHDIL